MGFMPQMFRLKIITPCLLRRFAGDADFRRITGPIRPTFVHFVFGSVWLFLLTYYDKQNVNG